MGYTKQYAPKKQYTPEERAEYEQRKQADIEAMIERINEGVKAVFQSDKYKEYLKFASKFTDYSARNTLLINMQKPDATLVAAFGKWKQLGRSVDKGQKGIAILAPVPYKTNQYMEVDKPAVDEFGNQLYNPDGTEKTDTVEVQMTNIAFKKIYVFDVSQTSGKELPSPVSELTGDIDPEVREAVFKALKKVTDVDIQFRDIQGGAKGYYSSEKKQIVIKSGMSDAQTLKTAFHEAAHCLLHDPKKEVPTNKAPRNEKEVQAESIAFMVAEKFGIDTSEYSFPYIASWSDGKQLDQLKNALQDIQSAAKTISNAIESELLKLKKKDLSMEEKLADTDLSNVQKAEFLIEDAEDRGIVFQQEDIDKILDSAKKNEDIRDTVKLLSDMESILKQRMPTNDILNCTEDDPQGLVSVSKQTALEMLEKSADVYIDDTPVTSRTQLENAPDTAKIYVSECQYAAQFDFDRAEKGNAVKPQKLVEPADVAKAIDKAVLDNNFKLYHYDLNKAAADIIAEYGAERVSMVLAEYVVRHDYDGRIARENKEWAKGFDIPPRDFPPVFQTHPTVLDGFITEARAKIKELEQTKTEKPALSSLFDNRFLHSTERVELKDDYRGIPETKYYNSSVNEYFVEGIGWLDDAAYDMEQKMSGLNAKDFYAKVTQVNAAYIDTEGNVGDMDMTRQEYDLMTEKTYSPDNAAALTEAKEKLAERYAKANVSPKPVEYYAVRQNSSRKFAICTISADGLITAVDPKITTIAEAKKKMTELFDKKKSSVRCEFVHPQTLDEKSAELFKGQGKELPAVTYRIQFNDDKNASPDNTHFLQEYIKNDDDTYAIGRVIVRGDYDKCNAALAEALAKKDVIEKVPAEKQKADFVIYQLKSGDDTRDIRFEPFRRLAAQGIKPDFNNYNKVYEGSFDMLQSTGSDVGSRLEDIFYKFNEDRPDDFKGHSLSVSDVVAIEDQAYYVDSIGFKPLPDFITPEIKREQFITELPGMMMNLSKGQGDPQALAEEAKKMHIPLVVMREAAMLVDSDRADDALDYFEGKLPAQDVKQKKQKL